MGNLRLGAGAHRLLQPAPGRSGVPQQALDARQRHQAVDVQPMLAGLQRHRQAAPAVLARRGAAAGVDLDLAEGQLAESHADAVLEALTEGQRTVCGGQRRLIIAA